MTKLLKQLELSERCAAATEGAFALDDAIYELLFTGEGAAFVPFQHFTRSIDAAISLVPEGWFTFLAGEDRHSQAARWSWHLRGGFGINAKCRGQTAALAICAAALKARASL